MLYWLTERKIKRDLLKYGHAIINYRARRGQRWRDFVVLAIEGGILYGLSHHCLDTAQYRAIVPQTNHIRHCPTKDQSYDQVRQVVSKILSTIRPDETFRVAVTARDMGYFISADCYLNEKGFSAYRQDGEMCFLNWQILRLISVLWLPDGKGLSSTHNRDKRALK